MAVLKRDRCSSRKRTVAMSSCWRPSPSSQKMGQKSCEPIWLRRTDLSCFAFHFLQKGWNILWLWGFFLGPGHCGQTNPKQGAQAQFNLHEGKVEGQRNCGRISPSEVSHNACTPNLPWW